MLMTTKALCGHFIGGTYKYIKCLQCNYLIVADKSMLDDICILSNECYLLQESLYTSSFAVCFYHIK